MAESHNTQDDLSSPHADTAAHELLPPDVTTESLQDDSEEEEEESPVFIFVMF